MVNEEQLDRVWGIIERVGMCMLTTRFAGGLRARPLEARPDRDDGRIWFVTDLHSGKEQEIESEDDVGLVFIDAREKAYLSITARAQGLRDPAKAAAIWKSTDNVWWRGPDDPNVCVLRVTPITAELWDGPAAKPSPRSPSWRFFSRHQRCACGKDRREGQKQPAHHRPEARGNEAGDDSHRAAEHEPDRIVVPARFA